MERAGVSSRIYRAPAGLTERGCAYAVRIRERDLMTALAALRQAELPPMKLFLCNNGACREMKI